MDELKPCPFCGGSAAVNIGPSIVTVQCEKCGEEHDYAKHGDWRDDWNTRPIEDALRAQVEQLTAALEKIAAFTDCNGPGCMYCDGDAPHPPTLGATIARRALGRE